MLIDGSILRVLLYGSLPQTRISQPHVTSLPSARRTKPSRRSARTSTKTSSRDATRTLTETSRKVPESTTSGPLSEAYSSVTTAPSLVW